MADLFFTGWRKWGALIAILIALLVPLLAVAKAVYDSNAHPVAKIRITGYDPRDMLFGHYMMFRFDWDWVDGQPPEDDKRPCFGETCCLCLGEGDTDPAAAIIACDAPESETPQCTARLKGAYYGGDDFDIGYRQYFVSETRALELEKMLRDTPDRFRMGITLPPSGKARLKGLYVDDMTVEDYLRANPPPQPPASDAVPTWPDAARP